MTEGRYFYTISGSILDGTAHTLDEALDILLGAISGISNSEHLHIDIQGPNNTAVINHV